MKKLFFVFMISSVSLAQNYGLWKLTDSLNTPRRNASSVRLANGDILVSGGTDSIGIHNAEIYNYKLKEWKVINPMLIGRQMHKLVLLNDGRILAIAGGDYEHRSCEIYDTTNGLWSLADSLNISRDFGETATILNNGNILVAGGLQTFNGGFTDLNSCEIYDVKNNLWNMTDSLRIARRYHTSTKLTNGKILVVGGENNKGELADCEIYDPITGKWTEVAPLHIARYDHSATLLSDGKVLVTGGINYNNPITSWLKSCELYDPTQNTWTVVDSLLVPHTHHSAILLNNGLLLIAGGDINSNLWELYDPSNFTNVYLGNFPDSTITDQLMNLLPNGKVLSAGGTSVTNVNYLPRISATNVCYSYDPSKVNEIHVRRNNIVKEFKLYQNYPNPFNPGTIIRYKISQTAHVVLKVYNTLAKEITILVNKTEAPGTYSVNFNSEGLASGVYFYVLHSGGYSITKKMIYLR